MPDPGTPHPSNTTEYSSHAICGRGESIAGQILGVGNHLGQTAQHTQTHHLPHLPPHPAPYNLAHTPDNQPYDPWPEGWGHAPDPIDDNTLRIFLKNPDGIKPKIKDNCNKLDTGLKDLADLGAGIILINEHNSDTK